MKLHEILTLTESAKPSYEDQAFIHMEHSLNTFGEFMKKFPYLDQLIKDIALEHEWSGDVFTKLKNLQIPEKYLNGGVSKADAITKFFASEEPIVLAHFTSVDEEIGFQADSMFHQPIIIKIPDGVRRAKFQYYILEVRKTGSLYTHTLFKQQVVDDTFSNYHNVNFKEYADDVRKLGVEFVLDNMHKYSQINMLTVFSNEV